MVGALPHPLSNIIELILHSLTPLTGAITVTAEWKGPTQSGSITCTVALRTMIDLLIAMDTDIEVGAVSLTLNDAYNAMAPGRCPGHNVVYVVFLS